MTHWLRDFVAESNRIEGILREPTDAEIMATEAFLDLQPLRLSDLEALVDVYQPGAILRRKGGLNVRVGNHIALPGGPEIEAETIIILQRLQTGDPWELHVAYEDLHPFTDGNGRSGRALWAWMMVRRQVELPLGFLHQFYYQTLERSR